MKKEKLEGKIKKLFNKFKLGLGLFALSISCFAGCGESYSKVIKGKVIGESQISKITYGCRSGDHFWSIYVTDSMGSTHLFSYSVYDREKTILYALDNAINVGDYVRITQTKDYLGSIRNSFPSKLNQ